MPLNRSFRTGLAIVPLVALLAACQAHSGVRPSAPELDITAAENDSLAYRRVACPKPVPEPYIGHLRVESKYDQSDRTKSSLRSGVSAETEAIKAAADTFAKRLVAFVSYFSEKDAPAHKRRALACVHVWLQTWSEAGAMLSTDTTSNGKAVRKWFLAAVSSALLRLQREAPGVYQLTPEQENWLHRLAQHVIDDYTPRLSPEFRYFNNHDYWAAWAVMATSRLLGNDALLTYPRSVLARALQQITTDPGSDLAWLPAELARGRLAANYTHYALVPLMLLAWEMDRYISPLPPEDKARLRALGRFAIALVETPERTRPFVDTDQEPVPPYKLAWLYPWLDLFPDEAGGRALLDRYREAADGYTQAGGKVSALLLPPS